MNWWQRILLLILVMAGMIWGFFWLMEQQAEVRLKEPASGQIVVFSGLA